MSRRAFYIVNKFLPHSDRISRCSQRPLHGHRLHTLHMFFLFLQTKCTWEFHLNLLLCIIYIYVCILVWFISFYLWLDVVFLFSRVYYGFTPLRHHMSWHYTSRQLSFKTFCGYLKKKKHGKSLEDFVDIVWIWLMLLFCWKFSWKFQYHKSWKFFFCSWTMCVFWGKNFTTWSQTQQLLQHPPSGGGETTKHCHI